MSYQGNLAYSTEPQRYDAPFNGLPYRSNEAYPSFRPSFEVVEGGGLDAKVRAGVSEHFLHSIKLILAVTIVFVAIGMVRVGILAACVSTLQSNNAIVHNIEKAQLKNGELRVERSILSSTSRIARIASQSYGMQLPSTTDTIDIAQQDSPKAGTQSTQDAQDAQGEQDVQAAS